MIVEGTVWKFGDNINTDEIIPARYLNSRDPQELAQHCMEDAEGGATFLKQVTSGDIIIGASNFGCGSSREHAPIAIKARGVSLVIAKTFARIFFRNAINIGLPILECPEIVDDVKTGEKIEVNLEAGTIKNVTTHKEYHASKYPPFMQELISAGGLMEWVKKKGKE
ncbi:MAG: 3-isopropylmalate dehydratase small subunit [Candidatus Omnitrophica bacterium]|nr:3-isopropylmalate dehydratase small subunit [Candidatus Omnitrophota bacterium]